MMAEYSVDVAVPLLMFGVERHRKDEGRPTSATQSWGKAG